MDGGKGIHFLIIVFAMFVIGGFFLIFDSLTDIKNDVKNMGLSLELYMRGDKQATPYTSNSEEKTNIFLPAEPAQKPETKTEQNAVSISTAIIFDARSSAALLPQTQITVAIEGVSRQDDGIMFVNFKAYTNQASSYSSLEPRDIFKIIFLSGDQQSPINVNGTFYSIPPKSAASGSVEFRIDPKLESIILQVGTGEAAKFYSFDFIRKTYKETVIG